MKRTCVSAAALFFFVFTVLVGPAAAGSPREEGEITGTIEKANEAFLRDYEELDYKSQKQWEDWGKGLKSLGWVVVQGDSGEPKDLLLLVIDTRTEIEINDSGKSPLADFGPGVRIEVKYRMGWDALHAIYVKKLGE
jgi:hypothetical protein